MRRRHVLPNGPVRLALVAAPMAALALLVIWALPRTPARAAEGDESPRKALVGVWDAQPNEFLKISAAFLPDGRYSVTYDTAGVKTEEHGKFVLKDDRLTFNATSGGHKTYKYARRGDERFVLEADDVPAQTYTRQAGSEKAVVEKARKDDEAKAREDEEWKAKLTVGGVEPGEAPVAGDIVPDKHADAYFKDSTVFKPATGYIRLWLQEQFVVRDGPDPGKGYNQTRWYFFPNGRVFYKDIHYTRKGPDTATVRVTDAWGKYKIERGEAGAETVSMVMDSGEKIAADLIDGRRNLRWGETVYGNPTWEQEALKRLQQGGGADGGGDNPAPRDGKGP